MPPILTLLGLHLLGLLSPGPDFAIIMKNTMLHSRRAGIATAVGIACGIIVTLTYCILGLGLLIEQSPIAFTAVKTLGALYLIYIGIKALRAKVSVIHDSVNQSTHTPVRFFKAWLDGFVCHVLNPKAALFILGLFTLVVKTGTPMLVQVGYGVAMTLLCLSWFSMLAIMVTHPRLLEKIRKIQPIIMKVMGVLLILFGVKIALMVRAG